MAHQDLVVWRESMRLVKLVYQATADFPDDELYGLTSQMRRAAVSIPSNIAEGAGRGGQKEFRRFLLVARGSLSELETQILLAVDLGFLDRAEPLMELVERIFKLLAGLLKSISAK